MWNQLNQFASYVKPVSISDINSVHLEIYELWDWS